MHMSGGDFAGSVSKGQTFGTNDCTDKRYGHLEGQIKKPTRGPHPHVDITHILFSFFQSKGEVLAKLPDTAEVGEHEKASGDTH